ncbi:TRAP transporter small permease [Scandinavium manionii]|uniref:TRAP transporter small permease n=1 Tax=Scandinavium manionii TaxID=2926520 RepID=UPI0021665E81|nr:TRAP transporter small permease [Scandinavium manionii]MCS2167525.1 TRAP transporter small permease [Scandinavium manionii]
MKYIHSLELALARVGLAAIVVIILIGGLGRALGHPVIWSLEIAIVIFAWISMFAIDYAFQTRNHIGIDAITRLLPQRVQHLLVWISELIILAFLLCGVWYGYNFTWTTHHQTLPVTEISLAWLNSAVPTGCLLMTFTSLSFLLNGCRKQQSLQEMEEPCS